MRLYSGRVKEIQLPYQGRQAAWIACPPGAIPAPGQYLQAFDPAAGQTPLAASLFPAAYADGGFQAAAPVPEEWLPGTVLRIRGPLGRGFRLPPTAHRVALGVLGDKLDCLLPVVDAAVKQQADVALFTDLPLPRLPASVEVHPLASLPEAPGWADWLALDLPLEALADLRACLGLVPRASLACAAQALIHTAMPCSGIGTCGACAVPDRQGWKLVCKDGPVFDLDQLDW